MPGIIFAHYVIPNSSIEQFFRDPFLFRLINQPFQGLRPAI
jgi:hypothetical protein